MQGHGLLQIFFHAMTALVKQTQIIYGREIFKRNSLFVKCAGLSIIAFHAVSVLVKHAKIGKSGGNTIRHRQQIELQRFLIILFYMAATLMPEAKIVLRCAVTFWGGFRKILERLFIRATGKIIFGINDSEIVDG